LAFVDQLKWDVSVAGVDVSAGLAFSLAAKVSAEVSDQTSTTSSFSTTRDLEFGYNYRYNQGMYPVSAQTSPSLVVGEFAESVAGAGSQIASVTTNFVAGAWAGGAIDQQDVLQLHAGLSTEMFCESEWSVAANVFNSDLVGSSEVTRGDCDASTHDTRTSGKVGSASASLSMGFRAEGEAGDFSGYSWKGDWGPWAFPEADLNTTFAHCQCQADAVCMASPSSPLQSPVPGGSPTSNVNSSPTETAGGPTASGGGDPSGAPTATPSATPTGTPTGTPTANPTANPTATPTLVPTGKPTASPTRLMKPSLTSGAAPSTSTFSVEADLQLNGLTFREFETTSGADLATVAVSKVLSISASRVQVVAVNPLQIISRRRLAQTKVDVNVTASDFPDEDSALEAQRTLQESIENGELVKQMQVEGLNSVSSIVANQPVSIRQEDKDSSTSEDGGLLGLGSVEILSMMVPIVGIMMFGVIFVIGISACVWYSRSKKSGEKPTSEDAASKEEISASGDEVQKESDQTSNSNQKKGRRQMLKEEARKQAEDATTEDEGDEPHVPNRKKGDGQKQAAWEENDKGSDVHDAETSARPLVKKKSKKNKGKINEEAETHEEYMEETLPGQSSDTNEQRQNRMESEDTLHDENGRSAPPTEMDMSRLDQQRDQDSLGFSMSFGTWKGNQSDRKIIGLLGRTNPPGAAGSGRGTLPDALTRRTPSKRDNLSSVGDERGTRSHKLPGSQDPRGVIERGMSNSESQEEIPLTQEEEDLAMWLTEQCFEQHFDALRERGVHSIEDVFDKVDAVLLSKMAQISRVQGNILLSSIKMQKVLFSLHR